MTATEKKLRRRLSRLSAGRPKRILMDIIWEMYPNELRSGTTTEWTQDTIENVAYILREHNLVP